MRPRAAGRSEEAVLGDEAHHVGPRSCGLREVDLELPPRWLAVGAVVEGLLARDLDRPSGSRRPYCEDQGVAPAELTRGGDDQRCSPRAQVVVEGGPRRAQDAHGLPGAVVGAEDERSEILRGTYSYPDAPVAPPPGGVASTWWKPTSVAPGGTSWAWGESTGARPAAAERPPPPSRALRSWAGREGTPTPARAGRGSGGDRRVGRSRRERRRRARTSRRRRPAGPPAEEKVPARASTAFARDATSNRTSRPARSAIGVARTRRVRPVRAPVTGRILRRTGSVARPAAPRSAPAAPARPAAGRRPDRGGAPRRRGRGRATAASRQTVESWYPW